MNQAGQPSRRKKRSVRYSLLNLLSGTDLSTRRLPVMEMQGKEPGPVVWLTGCIHGDEVGGIVVIQEVFKRLQKEGLPRGAVHALPLMNVIGFENASREIPFTNEDLNRSFPGKKNGTLAERIAERISSEILKTHPSLVVDLHNDWSASIPYALLDPYLGLKSRSAHQKSAALARATGLVVIDEQEEGDQASDFADTLSGSMLSEGIPSLTLELGGAYIVSEKDVAAGVCAVWNLLAALKMVPPCDDPMPYELPEKVRGKILGYSHQPIVEHGGILRFLVKPGELVKKGDPVGRVYNVFGKLEETLRAEHDGILLGHEDSSAVFPGTEAFAFGVFR